MATQLWNQEIDKTVDWGGDTSTGGAAVSGQFVQKFIKDTLASKFGYLHYNDETKKYQVFADQDDFNSWNADPTTNANLVLATFDAPAPATIKVDLLSEASSTILSTEKGNKIRFKYLIQDSSNTPQRESVSVRVQVSNGGVSQTFTQTYEPDYDGYKEGTEKEIAIDEYLSVGVNNITLNFTGLSSQATAVTTLRISVVELSIESSWDNTVAQEYDDTLDADLLFDVDKGNALRIPFKAVGQGSKYIEIYINGKQFTQTNGISFGDLLSGQQEYSSRMDLFLSNANGTLRDPFVEGKNTIQFLIYITQDGRKITSNTLYYDFVIKNVNNTSDLVYILYKQTLIGVFETGKTIEFSAQQYFSTSFDYSVYSSTGKSVGLTFDLVKRPEADGELSKIIATLKREINSGESQTFEYSFLDYGTVDVNITTDLTDIAGNPLDTLHVIVNVEKADVQISVAETDKTLEFNALNRSNSEPNPGTWESGNVKAEFSNIYWNDSAGWDGKALVLNNGAQCSIPFNFFGTNANDLNSLGLTVEMTFEMINVQDEEATMVTFEDSGNTSSIVMSASEARITDQSGSYVYTKYNANDKIKIAFIVNPYDRNKNFDSSFYGKQEYKNCTFIIINGILDKCDSYGGELIWRNVQNPKMIIGNKDGKAGIKLYSIRVYRKALSLDEELTNFIAESDDILAMNRRNDIYEAGTSSVSLDIVKNMIPTGVLYGDIDTFNQLTNKKQNMEFDLEFYDPTDPERDFYARGMWFSNQGTSSLAYPIRNLRPYFSKTNDSKTVGTANYYTEVYLGNNFVHGQVSDESTLGHFYTNAKTAKAYHRLYNDAQADKVQAEGIQLFYKSSDGSFIPCKKGVDAPEGYGPIDTEGNGGWFIQSYREIKSFGKTDDTWKFLKDLRLSGSKIYKIASEEEVENPISGNKYIVRKFEQVKGKKALNKDTKYFLQQGAWKQYHKSGYTDRWTFKTDYAESTMTQNAGAGRLWGDVMKNVRYNGSYACRTDAQTAVGNLVTADDERIDIRTSCDGKPIVMFNCPLIYNEDGTPKMVNGVRQYGTPIFIGLYNIMTDKSSTKLFGFEDIYDENGNKIYKADRTECFECLTNAAQFSQGLSIVSDEDETNTNMASRSVWGDYEARWPDVKYADNNGDEQQVAHTHNLESMWRFVNFCKPAVDYKVGIKGSDATVDGYVLSPYSLIPEDKYEEYWNRIPRPAVFTQVISGGNESYEPFEATEFVQWEAIKGRLYEYQNDFDYDRVYKELSGKRIEGHIYKGKVAGFDAKHGVFLEDIQFDEERVDDETNGVNFGDKIAGTPCETDYYIDVFLTQSGSRYTYTDEHGKTANYTGESIDRDAYEKNDAGESYAGKTYMDYFSDKKYDFFNIPRLAAYYIYVIRFAAADQVVKNTMLTTEDGKHYYYINYDNDTILGTRNDGNLVFHWNVNRDSYDYEKNSFCFAGPKSVLWNLLECDEDFMRVVKAIDNAMYTSNVLSADILLDMFNNKQEGSWGERMYNINEKYKYLSQWTGDDVKYLKFIHGSAHQFRSWFVENRFNYYDSLWESGEYVNSSVYMRMDTMNTDKVSPMFYITAARQNKFWLSNSDGRYKELPEWKKNLKQDEREPWIATVPIYGNSSPFTLYGCDKIKELDFRCSTGLFDLQALSFVVDTKNPANFWMDNKGCLMTKLLIGISDDFRTTPMFRYTNISEELAVLTQATLSGDRVYNSQVQLPYDEDLIVETFANGVYTYKSKDGSEVVLPIVTIEPGKYVDVVEQVNGFNTEIISQEALGKTQCSIASFGSIGRLYSLEEIDIRNCYNESGLLNDDIDLTGLNNLHVYRAIGSSITSFVPAIGAVLNEVSLPVNRIKTLTLDNVTLRKAEGQEAPVLKYTPDYALTSLTLNNVVFGDEEPAIDIVEFINTWLAAHKEKGTDPKSLSLTLNGVNITATVEWLKEIKKLNLVSFTGDVFVIGSDVNEKMTEDEYNELGTLYANERPFEPTSALRFDSAPAIFWSVKGDGVQYIKLDTEEDWGSGRFVTGYYSLLHGNKLQFQVTQFPVTTDGKMQLYGFEYMSLATDVSATSPWATAAFDPTDYASGKYKVTNNGFNLLLTPAASGYSTFISDIANGIGVRNIDRFIRIYPISNDSNRAPLVGYEDSIFVKITPVVNPETLLINFNGENIVSTGNHPELGCPIYPITLVEDMKDYEFNILYSNAEAVTVDGKLPEVTIYQTQNGSESVTKDNQVIIKDIKRGITTEESGRWGGSFVINPLVNPTKVLNKYVLIKLPLNSAVAEDKYAILDITIPTITPSTATIGEPADMDRVFFNTTTSEDNTSGRNMYGKEIYKVSVNRELTKEGIRFPIISTCNPDDKQGYDKSNIPVKSATLKGVIQGIPQNNFQQPKIVQEDGVTYIEIIPSNALLNGIRNSYDYEYEFAVDVVFGYDRETWNILSESQISNSFTYKFNVVFDISVIYPRKFKVVYKDNKDVSIDSETPSINAGKDGESKTIDFTVVPYDTLQKDDITVNITEWNIKVTPKETESNILPPFTIEQFVQFNMDSNFSKSEGEDKSTSFTWSGENGQNFPTLSLTINKWKFNGTAEDYIQEFVGEFEISAKYKDVRGNSVNVDSTNIEFSAIQSIAQSNIIDECVPYYINLNDGSVVSELSSDASEDEYMTCPWYLVDSENQYYRIDRNIIDQLLSSNSINKLVGVAKRVNYGWDDPERATGKNNWLTNDELNGDKYHNACLYWENDPNISVVTRSNSKNIYYRALCLPLANWKLSKDDLKKYGFNESTDATWYSNSNMEISAFFTRMCWMMGSNSSDVNYIKKIAGNSNEVINYHLPLTSEALHMNMSVKGLIGNKFVYRPIGIDMAPQSLNTSGNSDNITHFCRSSMIDAKAAMTAFCTANYSDWNTDYKNTLSPFGGIDNVDINMLWGNKSWTGSNIPSNHSAVIDIWHHFKLYDPQICPTQEHKDNSHVKCYIPSPYELGKIFGVNNDGVIENVTNEDGTTSLVPKSFEDIYQAFKLQNLFKDNIFKEDDTFIGMFRNHIDPALFKSAGVDIVIASLDWTHYSTLRNYKSESILSSTFPGDIYINNGEYALANHHSLAFGNMPIINQYENFLSNDLKYWLPLLSVK